MWTHVFCVCVEIKVRSSSKPVDPLFKIYNLHCHIWWCQRATLEKKSRCTSLSSSFAWSSRQSFEAAFCVFFLLYSDLGHCRRKWWWGERILILDADLYVISGNRLLTKPMEFGWSTNEAIPRQKKTGHVFEKFTPRMTHPKTRATIAVSSLPQCDAPPKKCCILCRWESPLSLPPL